MKRELKKYLNSLEEKELINEIVKLYDKFKLVKQYYELELGNDSSKLLDEFKEKIQETINNIDNIFRFKYYYEKRFF